MKKSILFLLLAFCFGSTVLGQATFTVTPALPTAEQEITITVNVANEPRLNGVTPIYIWLWAPDNSAITPYPQFNGDWAASLGSRLMTQVGPTSWTYTFTPTQTYNASVGQIGKKIGFLPI